MKSKIKVRKVKVQKQTIEELLEDNKGYIALLEREHGKKAADEFIEYLKRELEQVPESGTSVEMPIVELGKGD